MLDNNCVTPLENVIKHQFGLAIDKKFSLTNVDNMLTFKPDNGEKGEKIQQVDEENYIYPDELEDTRLKNIYGVFMDSLFEKVRREEEFTLGEWLEELGQGQETDVMKNGDIYSFIVHLCQKREYDLRQSVNKPDTFFEEIMREHYMKPDEDAGTYENADIYKVPDIAFDITGSNQVIQREGVSEIADLIIRRI